MERGKPTEKILMLGGLGKKTSYASEFAGPQFFHALFVGDPFLHYSQKRRLLPRDASAIWV